MSYMPDRLGARKLPISKNPEATYKDIQTLPPKKQVRHPNLPLEALVEIVKNDKELIYEAIQNPAFPLWELSDPALTDQLWAIAWEVASHTLKSKIKRSDLKVGVVLASELLLEALPIWDAEVPENNSPRECVKYSLAWVRNPLESSAYAATMASYRALGFERERNGMRHEKSGTLPPLSERATELIDAAQSIGDAVFFARSAPTEKNRLFSAIKYTMWAMMGDYKAAARERYVYVVRALHRLYELRDLSESELAALADSMI